MRVGRSQNTEEHVWDTHPFMDGKRLVWGTERCRMTQASGEHEMPPTAELPELWEWAEYY